MNRLRFAVMLLLLSAISWAIYSQTPTPTDPRVFPELSVESLTALQISDGTKEIAITRSNSGWGIAGLSDTVLDRNRLAQALRLITNFRFENELADKPADLGPFGLTGSALTAKLRWGDPGKEREAEIVFGTKNPFSQRRYALLKGMGRLGVVDNALFSALSADLSFWRSKTPFLFRVEDVLSASVSGERSFQVERRGAGWLLTTKDGPYAGDAERIEEALRAFSQQEISDFVDTPSAELAEALSRSPNELTLNFKVRGGVVRKLTLATQGAGEARRIFLRFSDRPTIYQIPGKIVPEIFRENFRLKMPLYLEPYSGVAGICLSTGVIIKGLNEAGPPCQGKVRQHSAEELGAILKALYHLAVLSFLDTPPTPFSPELTAEIHSSLGTSRLRIGGALPGSGKMPPRYAEFTGSDGRKSYGVVSGSDAAQLTTLLARE